MRNKENAFLKYEELLIELFHLIDEERSDNEEATYLREVMSDYWDYLDDKQKIKLNTLALSWNKRTKFKMKDYLK